MSAASTSSVISHLKPFTATVILTLQFVHRGFWLKVKCLHRPLFTRCSSINFSLASNSSSTSYLMAAIGRALKNVFLRTPSPPRKYPSSGFKVINTIDKLEEENWEWYKPGLFYPVCIGEVFQTRYQVVGKLGYGSHSTAWLCRDLKYGMSWCLII